MFNGPREDVVIGMCQLETDDAILPGHSGHGELAFAPDVSALVRSLVHVGTVIALNEGRRRIGTAGGSRSRVSDRPRL